MEQAEQRAKQAEARITALSEHLARLQRVTQALIESRRWRYGARLGDAYTRISGRKDSTETRVRRLLAEGRALLAQPAAGHSAVAYTAARGRKASAHYAFNDFAQYLNHALLNPFLPAPFTEADLQVLGVMDDERRRRLARAAVAPHPGLVSVVLPTRNRADGLARAIESVLSQRYGDWELLVVDRASTDGTAELLDDLDDPRIRALRLDDDRGGPHALNLGMHEAHGVHLTYLDAGTQWHPDYLTVMVHGLAEADGYEAAYCAQEVWRSAGGGLRTLAGLRFGPFNRSLLENRNTVDLTALVHHRSLYERLGGFDADLAQEADWELVLRYTAAHPPLAVPCLLAVSEQTQTEDRKTGPAPLEGPVLTLALPDGEADVQTFGVATAPPRPGLRRGVSVVIPSYEALPYLQAAIASVRACTPLPHRLIVVDNGSSQPLRDWLHTQDDLDVVLNDGNLGFTAAVNQGIARAADQDDIVLLNNDALVTPGWLEGLQEALDLVPDTGLVVPRQTLFPGTRTMKDHVPAAEVARELDVTLSVHHGNVLDAQLLPQRGLVELTFAPFFCVYIPRATLDAVGPLDAENGPHYRSDRLYCDVVRRHAGRRVVYTPHAKLYHFLQRSTAQLKQEDPEHYQRMFVDNDWASVSSAAAR